MRNSVEFFSCAIVLDIFAVALSVSCDVHCDQMVSFVLSTTKDPHPACSYSVIAVSTTLNTFLSINGYCICLLAPPDQILSCFHNAVNSCFSFDVVSCESAVNSEHSKLVRIVVLFTV